MSEITMEQSTKIKSKTNLVLLGTHPKGLLSNIAKKHGEEASSCYLAPGFVRR